jgi:hypothetical protein
MSIINREFDSQTIRIRSSDRYVCLTDMAKASGKLFADWMRLKSTASYLDRLSAVMGIPITKLVQVVQGGIPENQGTWGHPKVSLRFAQWCSDEFAIQVDTWIDELLRTGKVELSNQDQGASTPKQISSTDLPAIVEAIFALEKSGDAVLSQMCKNLLKRDMDLSLKNALPAAKDPLPEAVVEVAIRLGYSVPSGVENGLGRYVANRCGDLIVGKDERYAASSGKKIGANLYPAYNTRVEETVHSYFQRKLSA